MKYTGGVALGGGNGGPIVHLFNMLDMLEIKTSGWINIKFDRDINGPQRLNPNDFGDPLTFLLAPPAASQNVHFSVCDRIPPKLMIHFSSAKVSLQFSSNLII